MIITDKDIYNFKKCRVFWDYYSPMRKGLEPEVKALKKIRNRAMKKTLIDYYQYSSDLIFTWQGLVLPELAKHYPEMSKSELKNLDFVYTGRETFLEYLFWEKHHKLWDNIFHCGESFYASLNKSPHVLEIKPDMIVEKDGKLWLVDFKITTQLPRPDSPMLNYLSLFEKHRAYLYVLEQKLKEPISNVMLINIRFKAPKTPKLLKQKTRLSCSKTQGTSLRKYLDRLAELGQSPARYKDFIQYLKGTPWVTVIESRYSDRDKERTWQDYNRVVEDMLAEDLSIYPNPTPMNCAHCVAYEECYAR